METLILTILEFVVILPILLFVYVVIFCIWFWWKHMNRDYKSFNKDKINKK